MGSRKEALGNSESVGQTISASEEWQEAGSPELEVGRFGPCWAHLCFSCCTGDPWVAMEKNQAERS